MSINEIVKQIHKYNKDNNTRLVIAITGGGISALSYLFSQPGASSSILECTVPYACESTLEYTGVDEIKSWSSFETANLLASSAFLRCKKLNKTDYISIGIGATGNLVSSETLKRGSQGIYISIKTSNSIKGVHLNLYKGEKGINGEKDKPFRTRQDEDEICSKLIIYFCALELGLINTEELIKFMELDSRDILEFINI